MIECGLKLEDVKSPSVNLKERKVIPIISEPGYSTKETVWVYINEFT